MQRTGTTISQDLKNENDLGPFTRTVRDEKSIDTEYVRDKLSIFGRRPARKWAAVGDGGARNVYFIRRVSVQREAREGWTSIIFNEWWECNIMGNNRSLPAWELKVTSTKRT